LEKPLHSRAEQKTNRGFKNIGWWFKFSFCYLVTRKNPVMPSKECVRQVKVKRFEFYVGACIFAVAVVGLLFILK
jgi:hypothetical protein